MIARFDMQDGRLTLVLEGHNSTDRAMPELHGAQFCAREHVDSIGTRTWVIQSDDEATP